MVTTETSYSIWKLNFPVVASIYEKEYSVGTVSYNTEHWFFFNILQCQTPKKMRCNGLQLKLQQWGQKAFSDLQVNCTAASYTHMINHIMIPSK